MMRPYLLLYIFILIPYMLFVIGSHKLNHKHIYFNGEYEDERNLLSQKG